VKPGQGYSHFSRSHRRCLLPVSLASSPGRSSRRPTVPVHAGRDVLKSTLRGILNSIGMAPDEFRALL